MQCKLRACINVKRTQMSLLKMEWTKEWDKMAVEYSSSKEKTDLDFNQRMEELEFKPDFISLKEELLRLYLEKCRYVYSLAFFQWRKYMSQTSGETEEIKMIFDERRDSILAIFANLEKRRKET